MFEKRWHSIAPQAFTSDGTSSGQLTVVDASLFKVKQIVSLSAAGQPNLILEVKSVDNATTMRVGPVGGSIKSYTNIALYTTIAGAFIFASEQERSSVPEQAIERLTYEEEPVVARRVVLVDKLGDKFDETNRLPTSSIQLFTKPFDAITALYPAPTQEIYESRVGGTMGAIQETVTINYTDATKSYITDVART
jgi:hypothetical protein